MGRNASEAWAGLEKEVVDADPAGDRGRQYGSGKQPTDAPEPVHRGKGHGTS